MFTLNFYDSCRFKITKAIGNGAAVFSSIMRSHFVKVNANNSSRRINEIDVLVWTHWMSILEPIKTKINSPSPHLLLFF